MNNPTITNKQTNFRSITHKLFTIKKLMSYVMVMTKSPRQ